MARKTISKDMLVAAQERGWTVSQAARQFSFPQSSIEAACDRFGVYLTYSSPVLTRSVRSAAAEPDNIKVKTFSASAASIEKALAEMARKKKLALMLK